MFESPAVFFCDSSDIQKEGLTGHPEAMDYPYNSVLWAGDLKQSLNWFLMEAQPFA